MKRAVVRTGNGYNKSYVHLETIGRGVNNEN